jgi:uncharacterized membrane protein
MTHSKPLSKKPLKIAKWIPIIMLVISILGFADASYLTIGHLRGIAPSCGVLKGCETVTSSSYSEIFGIPVALGGSFYYLFVFILSIAYLDTKKEQLIQFASILTPLGLAASIWFVYLQIVVLKTICLYCMWSALFSTVLFTLGMTVLYKIKKAKN